MDPGKNTQNKFKIHTDIVFFSNSNSAAAAGIGKT